MHRLVVRLRRIAGLAAVLLAAALAIPGLSQAEVPKAHVVVAVPVSPPKLVHVAVYVAIQEGFFAKEGLSVTPVQFQSGSQALRAVESGSADIGFVSSDDAMAAARSHSGVVTVWDQTQSLDTVAVANVPSAKDLVGKYVAVDGVPGFLYTQAVNALQQAGVSPSQVKFVNLPLAQVIPALVSGRVSMGILHADGAIIGEHKDPHLHIIDLLYKTLPYWWYGATVVQNSWAKAHRDVLVRFLEAMILADRWMYAHKAQVVALAKGPTGEPPKVLAQAYDILKAGQSWTVNTGLYLPWLEETIRTEVRYHEIPGYIDPRSFVDFSYVDAALKAVGRVSWGKP